ncbi:l(2)06496 family protein [Megaselia abdita]
MDNALDNLERRLDALDRILGPDANVSGKKSDFVDSLMSAETLVDSAMSGRENIKKVSDRSNELETYLNPDFLEDQQKFSRFAAYINSFSTELQGTFTKLEEIKSLESTLGAEYFRNIPGSSEHLQKLSDKNDEFKESQQFLEEQMMLSMKRFAEIEQGLVNDLATMNSRLDVVQDKIERRKKDTEEN